MNFEIKYSMKEKREIKLFRRKQRPGALYLQATGQTIGFKTTSDSHTIA